MSNSFGTFSGVCAYGVMRLRPAKVTLDNLNQNAGQPSYAPTPMGAKGDQRLSAKLSVFQSIAVSDCTLHRARPGGRGEGASPGLRAALIREVL